MKRLSYILLAAAGGLEFIFVMAQLQYWTNKDFTDQHFAAIQPLVRIGSNYPSIHYVAVVALVCAITAPFGVGDRLRAHRLYKRPVVEDYVPAEAHSDLL